MTPIERAYLSLEGLSLGDAFGQRFFGEDAAMREAIQARRLPDDVWYLTDDSIMSIGVVDVLGQYATINQDALAKAFAENYRRNPRRQYGGMASTLLREYCAGGDWRVLAPAVFDGMGSYGNGAAMRVAPLGAFFADDQTALVAEALKSAEVTHSHPEGQAGAVAIGAAAAWAWNHRELGGTATEFFEFIQDLTPTSETRDRIGRASRITPETDIEYAAEMLGRGLLVASQDTVPLVIWVCAHLDWGYTEAMWQTVSALGDRDTTCAMVGGIVALRTGMEGLPPHWLRRRESIFDWEPGPAFLG